MSIKNGNLQEKDMTNYGKSGKKKLFGECEFTNDLSAFVTGRRNVLWIFALSLGAMRPFDDAFYWRALLFA